jgi:uncharacterized protein (DUF433 family)
MLSGKSPAALNWDEVVNGSYWMDTPAVVVDPEIQSGAPVFVGTRVPVRNLFDYLEAGDNLEVFLIQFPSVTREMAIAVLEQAREALAHDAHPA